MRSSVAVAAHELGPVPRVANHALLGLEAGAVLGLEAQAAGDDQRLLVLLPDLAPEVPVLEDAVHLQLVTVPLHLAVAAALPHLPEDPLERVLQGRAVGLDHLQAGGVAELVLEQPRRLRREVDVGLAPGR